MKTRMNRELLKHDNDPFSVNEDSEFLSQLTGIFSVLSKNDALTIFITSYEGIKSVLDAPVKLGLTKKQYYTRLKQLVDLGLIVKHNESYVQTALGKIVYQRHVLGLTKSIKNSKYLQIIDTLKADRKFSDSDIMRFMSKVEPQANTDLYDYSAHSSTVTSSLDDMMKKLLEMMEFTRNEYPLLQNSKMTS